MNFEEYTIQKDEIKHISLDFSADLEAGEAFLQSVKALLTAQGITFTAVDYGVAGNSITITVVDPGIAQASTIFAVVGTDISVTLEHDGSAITATADSVIADFASAPAGVTALVTLSGSGATALTAAAEANLAGGLQKVTVSQQDISTEVPTSSSVVTNALAVTITDDNIVLLKVSGVAESKSYRIKVLVEADSGRKINKTIYVYANA